MGGLLDRIHGGYVHKRRVRVLSEELANLLPRDAEVLDVGSGDGLLDARILTKRPDVRIEGIDILVRDTTHIPVRHFNGKELPFPDNTFDVVQFVDVLHHTESPAILLKEAARVTRRYVVLKDHTRNGLLANSTLRFMDWVGNARHGVVLPYHYLSRAEWDVVFREVGLKHDIWKHAVPLYPFPVSLFLGRSLQFVARLEKQNVTRPAVAAPEPKELNHSGTTV
jgi:SAM-dependent methyltransferase